MRKDFEMTQGDLDALLDVMKPVPAIALNCGPIRSPQERANAAWGALGKKMGFDPMTVQPNGKGDRQMSADIEIGIGEMHCSDCESGVQPVADRCAACGSGRVVTFGAIAAEFFANVGMPCANKKTAAPPPIPE